MCTCLISYGFVIAAHTFVAWMTAANWYAAWKMATKRALARWTCNIVSHRETTNIHPFILWINKQLMSPSLWKSNAQMLMCVCKETEQVCRRNQLTLALWFHGDAIQLFYNKDSIKWHFKVILGVAISMVAAISVAS